MFTNKIDDYQNKTETTRPIVIAKKEQNEVAIRTDEPLLNYFMIDENKNDDIKNYILNLSGHSVSYVSNLGIISNSYVTNNKIYFDNCEFVTYASKQFGSWANETPRGYIKENCNPNQISDFGKWNYTGRAEWEITIYE